MQPLESFCHLWDPFHAIHTAHLPPEIRSLLKVEEISLAITTLRGADNVRQYYPNTQMVGASIVNLSRSDNRFDNFTVSAATRFVTLLQQSVSLRRPGRWSHDHHWAWCCALSTCTALAMLSGI